jgi:RNA polymerase sigma-70 factor (ECF subfamily)
VSETGLAELGDHELVTRITTATTTAVRDAGFVELVHRYERRVYGICYRYFGNHADAQDAAQDTFLTLARKLDTFQGGSKLSTWIYRVATNACNDLGRKYARRPQTPVEDVGEAAADASGSEATADDLLAGRELAHEIQQALLQLDELSRTLILLCSVEGQSYAEVSEALDLPIGTIKSRVFRARAKLAELLGPVLDPEDADDDPVALRPEAPTTGRDRDPGAPPRGPPPR